MRHTIASIQGLSPAQGDTRTHLRVALISTSFPLYNEAVSGTFVRRLAESLPAAAHIEVVTPCGDGNIEQPGAARYLIRCFRYTPKRPQIPARGPGGIPAALEQDRLSWLLLIPFVVTMFITCFRAARSADLIHANWSVTGVIAGLAGLMTRKPLITTLRVQI